MTYASRMMLRDRLNDARRENRELREQIDQQQQRIEALALLLAPGLEPQEDATNA